jgi:hypothetical protein
MIRLDSNRPLIFEHAARGVSRQSWIALTAASWGCFLYLLLPAVGSFVVAGLQHLGNPMSLLAYLNDTMFSALTAYGKLSGGTLALALGVTSLDRIIRHKPLKLTIDQSSGAAGKKGIDALASLPPFNTEALSAMRATQRLIAHHDAAGQLLAVTLLAAPASEHVVISAADPRLALSGASLAETRDSHSPGCAERSDYPKARSKRAARKSGK